MAIAALTGVLPSSATLSGQILINGSPVAARALQDLRGPTIGYAPQEGVSAFHPEASNGDQLRDLEHEHGRWRVSQACGAVRCPVEKLDLYACQMPGGEAQRAALAAALISAPAVLVADDPTASLDTALTYAVWTTLRLYADAGAAVLTVTNDVEILSGTGVDRISENA